MNAPPPHTLNAHLPRIELPPGTKHAIAVENQARAVPRCQRARDCVCQGTYRFRPNPCKRYSTVPRLDAVLQIVVAHVVRDLGIAGVVLVRTHPIATRISTAAAAAVEAPV